MSQEKITMDESEFCQVVGISRVTAWTLRRKGRLPHIRIGRKILYTKKQVDDFIRTNTAGFIQMP